MADSVDSVVLFDDRNAYVARFTNVSDGTGESSVVKVDVSALKGPDGISALNKVAVEEILWNTTFGSVRLFFDATTDDEIAMLSGAGRIDWSCLGGLVDPRSAGAVGDILLSTAGNASGAVYTVTLVLRKIS